MKTLFNTSRFIIIAFLATAISFGTVVTTTYAKSHKEGGSKAGSEQSSSNKKGDKAGKGSKNNKGNRASEGGKNKKRDKKAVKISRTKAVGAISAGADLVSPEKGKRPSQSARFISRFDQNSDGQVTLAEIQTASQTKFSSLDADANGSISSIELSAANTVTVADRVTKIISKEDNDGDGSRAEVSTRCALSAGAGTCQRSHLSHEVFRIGQG